MTETTRSKSGAAFKPRSNEEKTTQSSGTPREFLDAVEAEFTVKLSFDLACTQENCIAVVEQRTRVNDMCIPDPNGAHFVGKRSLRGYFHDLGVNALERNWNEEVQLPKGQAGWLNPEFSHIDPWVAKLAATDHKRRLTGAGSRNFALLPAGTGTVWFMRHVAGKAAGIYFLSPRIKFVDPSTGKPFQVWNKKKGCFQDAAINRDCMLLDYNSLPPDALNPAGEPKRYCWNWKTGDMVRV